MTSAKNPSVSDILRSKITYMYHPFIQLTLYFAFVQNRSLKDSAQSRSDCIVVVWGGPGWPVPATMPIQSESETEAFRLSTSIPGGDVSLGSVHHPRKSLSEKHPKEGWSWRYPQLSETLNTTQCVRTRVSLTNFLPFPRIVHGPVGGVLWICIDIF